MEPMTLKIAYAAWGGKSLGDEIIVILEEGHIALVISKELAYNMHGC